MTDTEKIANLEKRIVRLETIISNLQNSFEEKEDIDSPFYMYVKRNPYEGPRYACEKLYKTFYKKSDAVKYFNDWKVMQNDWKGGEARLCHNGKDILKASW